MSRNLASHCVWVIGNALTLISLEGMKQEQLSRRLVRVHLGAAGVAVAMMIICWWRAPIHSQFHEDLAPLAGSLAVTLYYAIFYAFMGWCLARAAWFCLGSRRAFRKADPARGASLLIIGFASHRRTRSDRTLLRVDHGALSPGPRSDAA